MAKPTNITAETGRAKIASVGFIKSSVRRFDTAANLLAANSVDSTLAYAGDTHKFYARAAAQWLELVTSGGAGEVKYTDLDFTGATATDHLTQYAYLAGRSGGQTLKGDTASGGALRLSSTSHATKGPVRIGSSWAVDEGTGKMMIAPSEDITAIDVSAYEAVNILDGNLLMQSFQAEGNEIKFQQAYTYTTVQTIVNPYFFFGNVFQDTPTGYMEIRLSAGHQGRARHNTHIFETSGTFAMVRNTTDGLGSYAEGYLNDGDSAPHFRINGYAADLVGKALQYEAGLGGSTDTDTAWRRTASNTWSALHPRTGALGSVIATTFTGAFSGNASTATALANARTLWGQSFDGTANVTGTLSSVGTVIGATGSGGSLTLQSTSNSTRGPINFGSAAAAYFDEANAWFEYAAGNDTVSHWRQFATNKTNAGDGTRDDQLFITGYNVNGASLVSVSSPSGNIYMPTRSDATKPAIATMMESYYHDGATRTQRYQIYMADASGAQFRPLYMTFRGDDNNDTLNIFFNASSARFQSADASTTTSYAIFQPLVGITLSTGHSFIKATNNQAAITQLNAAGNAQKSVIRLDSSNLVALGDVDTTAGARLGVDSTTVVAQTLAASSVTGASNTAGATLTIRGSLATGNAANGAIDFATGDVGGSGSAQATATSKWRVLGTGHLIAPTDNTYDFGADTATRARNAYVGTAVYTPLAYGGTGSGGALELRSTSHATKGFIYLGSDHKAYLDETTGTQGLSTLLRLYNGIASVGTDASNDLFCFSGQTAHALFTGRSTAGSAGTSGAMVVGVGTSMNRTLLLADWSGYNGAYAHGSQTNPTLIIHSATAAATATNEWISFAHNTTNGVITVGKGNLSIVPGSGGVVSTTSIATNAITSTQAAGGASLSEQFGASATASAANTLAVGASSTASAAGGVALGKGAQATATAAIAIGLTTLVGATGCLAIGNAIDLSNNTATNCTIVGNVTTAVTGLSVTAYGSLVNIGTGISSVTAIGTSARADQTGASAFGASAGATGSGGTSIGKSTTASGTNSSALGINSAASGTNSIAIGNTAKAGAAGTVIIGNVDGSSASATASVIVGTTTGAVTSSGIVGIGNGVNIGSGVADVIAIGRGAAVTVGGGIAIGQGSSSSTANSIALGVISVASGTFSTALGVGATGSATQTTAVGNNAIASGSRGTALGHSSLAGTSADCVAVGDSATVTNVANGIALGSAATVAGADSIAIGKSATTSTFTNSLAIGSSATVTANNQAQLGTSGQAYQVFNYGSIVNPIYYGGTASGGAIELGSTTHATKGKIYFGANHADFYDESVPALYIRTMRSNTNVILFENGTVIAYANTGGTASLLTSRSTSNAAMVYGMGSAHNRVMLITETGNYTTDHGHSSQTNPTVFLHSATAPGTDSTQWLSLVHDQTNAVIGGGKGNISLLSATGETRLSTSAVSAGLILNSLTPVSGFPTIGQSSGSTYFRGTSTSTTWNFQDNSGNANGIVNAPDLTSSKSGLTAGTMTDNVKNAGGVGSGYLRIGIAKFTWTNAMVTAIGATTAGDVSVCTLPAKTVIKRCWVAINTAGAGTTTLTVAIGRGGGANNDYVLAKDAKAAANTVYGALDSEIGSNLLTTGAVDSTATARKDDMPSFTGTTTINAHFISTGANLSAVTTSTGTVYIEYFIFP